jgi:archaellum component FlaC
MIFINWSVNSEPKSKDNMNPKEKIQAIETKIVEIKNTLQLWTNHITNCHSTLDQITEQLKEIKKNIK